jgi:hypothetical protein
MVDFSKYEDKKPLVYDGTGRYIDVCNFCGKEDIIFPTGTVYLCPKCLGKGDWRVKADKYMRIVPEAIVPRVPEAKQLLPISGWVEGYKNPYRRGRFVLIKDGVCAICGTLFFGAGASVEGWACFRCLWTKLGKRNDALRAYGYRVV